MFFSFFKEPRMERPLLSMAALLELLDWHLASKFVLSTEAMKDVLDLIGRHVALRKPPGTASYVTACLGSLQCCMQLIDVPKRVRTGKRRGMRVRCSHASLGSTRLRSAIKVPDPCRRPQRDEGELSSVRRRDPEKCHP
jgi:hypothetical protein